MVEMKTNHKMTPNLGQGDTEHPPCNHTTDKAPAPPEEMMELCNCPGERAEKEAGSRRARVGAERPAVRWAPGARHQDGQAPCRACPDLPQLQPKHTGSWDQCPWDPTKASTRTRPCLEGTQVGRPCVFTWIFSFQDLPPVVPRTVSSEAWALKVTGKENVSTSKSSVHGS